MPDIRVKVYLCRVLLLIHRSSKTHAISMATLLMRAARDSVMPDAGARFTYHLMAARSVQPVAADKADADFSAFYARDVITRDAQFCYPLYFHFLRHARCRR